MVQSDERLEVCINGDMKNVNGRILLTTIYRSDTAESGSSDVQSEGSLHLPEENIEYRSKGYSPSDDPEYHGRKGCRRFLPLLPGVVVLVGVAIAMSVVLSRSNGSQGTPQELESSRDRSAFTLTPMPSNPSDMTDPEPSPAQPTPPTWPDEDVNPFPTPESTPTQPGPTVNPGSTPVNQQPSSSPHDQESLPSAEEDEDASPAPDPTPTETPPSVKPGDTSPDQPSSSPPQHEETSSPVVAPVDEQQLVETTAIPTPEPSPIQPAPTVNAENTVSDPQPSSPPQGQDEGLSTSASPVAAPVYERPPTADTGYSGPVAHPQQGEPSPTEPTPPTNPDEYTIVLLPGSRLYRDEFVLSPNGLFSFILTVNGNVVLYRTSDGEIFWELEGDGATYLTLQPDGHLLLKRPDRSIVWSSGTSNNPGAYLRIDSGGQLAIAMEDGSTLWFAGVPRGKYTSEPKESLTFPLRGIFYYPWFPETWTVNDVPIKYNPTLGLYSNGDNALQEAHIQALEYAHVDLAIASWWGPSQKKDRARITNLMDKSLGRGIKWTIYHEEEDRSEPTVAKIQSDLEYLKKWFAWHDAWAHIDGRPVIFLWNGRDCGVTERWMEASNGEWFVVAKLFYGHMDCPVQPDHWHEYGPSNAIIDKPGHSFSVSPGFFHAAAASPNLPRLSTEEWRSNVHMMVDSNEPLQLINTFNEWGEGTAVESANEWATSSGFGMYLDVLHEVN